MPAVFAGWMRTGESFGVLALGPRGAAKVCRFWSGAAFAPVSSHFYTAAAANARGQGATRWRSKVDVFATMLSHAAGNCAAGTPPLYRLYNNPPRRRAEPPLHDDACLPRQMMAQGWIAEGAGPGIIACVRLRRAHGRPSRDASSTAHRRRGCLPGPQPQRALRRRRGAGRHGRLGGVYDLTIPEGLGGAAGRRGDRRKRPRRRQPGLARRRLVPDGLAVARLQRRHHAVTRRWCTSPDSPTTGSPRTWCATSRSAAELRPRDGRRLRARAR